MRRSASQNAARFAGRLEKGCISRAGVDTEPRPKSVDSAYPPGWSGADASPRRPAISSRCAVEHGTVLVDLQHAPQRLLEGTRVEMVAVQAHQRSRPVEALGHARRLLQRPPAQRLHEARDLVGEPRREARGRARAGSRSPARATGTAARGTDSAGASASDSSRVRLLVTMTCGVWRARIVPSSGIVTWNSASTSSRNASNASSARSTSSMSSTGGRSSVIAIEQRPFQQELFAEDLRLALGERCPRPR